MTASDLRREDLSATAPAVTASTDRPKRPAASAAARVSRAGLWLGALGLVSALVILGRLFESWRVNSGASAHRIVIFGQRLSYPAGNLEAIVILLLAALGFLVTGRAIVAAAREGRASRRFIRLLSRRTAAALDGALVIRDPRPQAFCAGLIAPRVYVSTGAVELLDEAALAAVLAHERHHARRRDPLRLAAGRALSDALFFLPALGDLVELHQSLAELGADETAVHAEPGNRAALARAMLSFADAPVSDGSDGVDPARIDYLLGEPPSWRFPGLLCLAALGILLLLVAVAVLLGRVASGSTTLALPVVSDQPCVVVLAALPAALGFAVARYARRFRFRIRSAPSSHLIK